MPEEVNQLRRRFLGGDDSRHLVCAEIAAGNERTASLLELPGLAAWVHSVPVGPARSGRRCS
jgi:hypothetical protein